MARLRTALVPVLALTVLVVAGLRPAIGQGGAPQDAAVPQMAPEIVLVRVAGPWRLDSASGFIRLVIARTSPSDRAGRLFVQWIGADAVAGRFEVVETAEVAEFFENGLALTDLRIEPAENDSAVHLEAVAVAQGAPEAYLLVLKEPGRIVFQRAGN